MLDFTASGWLTIVNEARIWVTALAFGAAGLAVPLTYLQVRFTNEVSAQKEERAAAAAARSSERIAAAEAEGARARADAAQANARTAELQLLIERSHAEQEKLKLEVELATRETLRLQVSLASRRLSLHQQQILQSALLDLARELPAIVVISQAEREPMGFRDDLAAALSRAGIKTTLRENTINPPQYGVVVYDTASGLGGRVAAVLRRAGIETETIATELDEPVIRVGIKPPAL